MTNDFCRGCGTKLQSEHADKPGYIPLESISGKKQLICRRCYRVTHYGELNGAGPDSQQIQSNLTKAIAVSDLLILVADFLDITGSIPVWQTLIGSKPYLLVLNKIDLLPERTKPEEVNVYLDQYLEGRLPKPRSIHLVSGLKGKGISGLSQRLNQVTAPGHKIACIGVTNVGKSSIIKNFLQAEGSAYNPTVSRYPGTTMGLSNWSILKGRNTLIDTPGFNPGGRFMDLLCAGCASRLMPLSKLEQKLWSFKPGKGLILGGLAGLEFGGDDETVAIAFAASQQALHRTDNSKIAGLLKEGPKWLNQCCEACCQKLDWLTETAVVDPNQDLSIAGLGWVSIRKKPAEIKLTLPKGILWEVRPALIGKKE